jgi:hypothetical protein
MMEFFGRIFGLTATLISATILLLFVALAAKYGLLDDIAHALIAIVMLPVKIVTDVLIPIIKAATSGGLFSGGPSTPPPTTLR